MEYVQVPIPEEHVAGVLQFVQTLRYAHFSAQTLSPGEWDQTAMARLLRDLDGRARTLLLRAADVAAAAEKARAGDDVEVLTIRNAARELGCTEREVLGLIVELNDVVRRDAGPPFALVTGDVDGSPGMGAFSWPITMAGDTARFLLAAAGDLPDPTG